MAAAARPLLSCHDVSKHFGALAAVKDLSFEVFPGDILGISGPNGAGKTTLFEAISGLNPATAGSIVFDGEEITGLQPEAICHAGIARIFQLNAAFESLSVRENVRVAAYFGRDNRKIPGLRIAPEVDRMVQDALASVGLTDKDDMIAGELPVLDRKLLMLAGALATQPKLLLMDEPVGGLSPQEIDHMIEVVRRIAAGGITIILIEHVMRFLVQLSNRILVMHHGERIYEGSPDGLVKDEAVVDVYLGKGASERLAALMAAAGP